MNRKKLILTACLAGMALPNLAFGKNQCTFRCAEYEFNSDTGVYDDYHE